MGDWIKPKNYLKPCPFCGGKPMMLNPGWDCYRVFCQECGVEVPDGETEEEVTKTWNTRAANEWISVKDRLPEEPEDGLQDMYDLAEYIVMIKGCDHPNVLRYAGGGEWYGDGDFYDVDYWMPLPEPPKESEVESDG